MDFGIGTQEITSKAYETKNQKVRLHQTKKLEKTFQESLGLQGDLISPS